MTTENIFGTTEAAAPGQTQAAPRKGTHAARIIAATRAAEAFRANRASLFDTPRVTGAVLKDALLDMVARSLATVPGIAPTSEIRVVFGDGASVRHEWKQSANAKQPRKVIACIMLPDFDDVALIPRAFADEMVAYTLHEMAHCIFTNPQTFTRGIQRLASIHGISEREAHGIVNAIEDVRIERALLASGYAAGFRGVIRGLLARTVAEAKANGCMQAFAAGDRTAWGFAFAFGGRGYASGAEDFRAALTPAHQRIFDRTAEALAKVAPNDAATGKVCDIASDVIAALAFEARQPGSNPGNGGQPGDGAPQPGAQPSQEDGQGGQDGAGKPGDKEDKADGQEAAGSAPGGQDGDQDSDQGDGKEDGQGGQGDQDEDGADGDQGGQDVGGQPGSGQGDQDGGQDNGGQDVDQDGTDGAGDGQSSVSRDGTAKDQPAPRPGTFIDTDPKPQGVPKGCEATGASVLQRPRVLVRDVDAAAIINGQAGLSYALESFTKAGPLQTTMRRLFSRSDRDAFETGRRSGRLNVGALPRVATGARDVFARRQSADGINSAVSILVDGSGSMSTRAMQANRAVMVLVKVLASCNGVKSKVQVFQDGGGFGQVDQLVSEAAREAGMYLRGNGVTLSVLKDYDDSAAHAFGALMVPTASGNTPDVEALTLTGLELAKRREARKVLVILVDGGTHRIAQTAQQVAMLKRRGVTCIAIGIAFDPQGYEHAINVETLDDLGGAAFRKIVEVIARQDGATN